MDDDVHEDEVASGRRVMLEGVPREQEDGDVVVPVQEHDRSFPRHQEERVTQLRELGHEEEEDPEAGQVIRSCGAHGSQESLLRDKEPDFDESSKHADVREDGESGVPGKEGPLEGQGFAGAHVVLTGVDAGQVEEDGEEGEARVVGDPFLEDGDVVRALEVRVEEVILTPTRVVHHHFVSCCCLCDLSRLNKQSLLRQVM